MLGGPMEIILSNGNSQRCALVQNSDETVVNIIIADPAVDPAPAGCTIIGLPEDSSVYIGWIYDPATGQFTNPNPPPPVVDPVSAP